MFHTSLYQRLIWGRLNESAEKPEPGQDQFMKKDAPYREKDKNASSHNDDDIASKRDKLFNEIDLI